MTGDMDDVRRQLHALVQEEKDFFLGNPIDDRILQLYLVFADFNVVNAFEKMKTVYRLKEKYKEFYAYKRDPELHDIILRQGIHVMNANRDQLGRRIYHLVLKHLVYGAHEPQEMFQVDDLWLSLALDEEETQKNGLVMLIDMEGFPWKFLRYFTPHILKVSTTKAENIPLKHVQYHIMNAGLLLNTVVQLIYPFLSQATKEAIFFHKNKESLHGHISRSVLPVEYGGEGPPLDPAALARNYLDTKNSRLAELLSYGYTTTTK